MASPFGSTNPFAGLQGVPLDYLNSNPEAGWGAYLNAFGQGQDPFSNWLRGQQGRYYTRFSGQNAYQPNLTWTDYMRQLDPMKDFQSMDRYARGENPQSWAGRTRWSM